MSTVKFSRNQIVNMMAASWAFGSTASCAGKRNMEQLAEAATRIIAANTAAFLAPNAPASKQPDVTAQELELAFLGMTVQKQSEALITIDRLQYNLVSNDGHNFATLEIMTDLFGIARRLLRPRLLGAKVA